MQKSTIIASAVAAALVAATATQDLTTEPAKADPVAPQANAQEKTAPKKPHYAQRGFASWYGKHFARKRTADGERFSPRALTAAHRSLPIDSKVRVTNLDNGRSVVVRINDRGPYIRGRIIDLSDGAAKAIGMKHDGTAPVMVVALNDTPDATERASAR